MQELNIYKSVLQRALVTFLAQVNNVSCQKLITYSIKEDKVLYAVNYIFGTVQSEWRKKDKQITAAFNQLYFYKKFCEFLQERILPAHMWQAKIIMKYYKMSQQPNQLVQKVKVALNKIKDQAVSEYSDRKHRNHLFNAIYITLKQDLLKFDKLMLTH